VTVCGFLDVGCQSIAATIGWTAIGTGNPGELVWTVIGVVTRMRFTRLQGQYLAFIDAYTKVNGRPPAEADMQGYFKVTPPSIHQMVITLNRLGLIDRVPGAARSIRVTIPPEDIPRLE
jgi:hypothetical protein